MGSVLIRVLPFLLFSLGLMIREKYKILYGKEMICVKENCKLLAQTALVSLVAIPLTVIGLGIAGYTWSEKVEPWLKKEKRIDHSEES